MGADEIFIIIVSSLTALSVFWLLFGIYKGSEDSKIGSIICLVLLGVFVWGVAGCTITFNRSEEKAKIILTKGEGLIFVATNDLTKVLIFDKKIDFDQITDTTTFYLEKQYNAYGIEVSDTHWKYFYKIDEEKYYNR